VTKATERWTLPAAARGCYLDASALAKLYWNEADSGALNRAVEGRDDLLASELSITETISAGARRCREGRLPAINVAAVRDIILSLGVLWFFV
jgi:predicted nucleic acid-binding protein